MGYYNDSPASPCVIKVLLANNLAVITYSSFPTKRKQRKQILRETKTLEVQQFNPFGMQG